MIWRLTYCNKEGVEARLDIIKGASTPVEVVEGTATPFILNYKMDKPDKSGFFMTSSADISIFETSTFNIDELKTSSETEIKVEFYINDVLDWSGFVIPDFFSKTIGTPATVEMVASDRLGTLKGVTLSGLNAKVSLSSLLSQCLAKTGLSLSVSTTAQFTHSGGVVNILNTEILSQRLSDPKGRNISCYDIVRSILILTNATLRQSSGSWVLYNKVQHEATTPSVTFDWVDVNAIRRIEPVASSVGVYQEYGGGRLHPDNYDFHNNLTGWTAHNGFTMFWRDEEVIGWNWETNEPIYGVETEKGFLINHKNRGLPPSFPWVEGETFETWPYAEVSVPVTASSNAGSVDVEVNFNISQFDRRAYMDYLILAVNGGETLAMDPSGAFVDFNVNNRNLGRRINFAEDVGTGLATASAIATGTINRPDAADFTIKVRIFGGDLFSVIFVNLVSVKFSSQTVANGNLFKTVQGSNYTKKHEIDTSIFGDYITSGLNGYFYTYPIDDTSSLYLPDGDLSRSWTAYGDSAELPLLQHVTRQRSRLFSVAHDILKATIDVASFNPMAVYQDCAGKKYVIVSASFDFLRSTVDAELEQVAYGSLEKKDYIYSYFGEGEEGISSIGGISSGGGGGGSTHSHPNKDIIDQLTQDDIDVLSRLSLQVIGTEMVQAVDEFGDPLFDENDDPIMEEVDLYGVEIAGTAYATEELSAYGYGGGGGGGGGAIATLSDVQLTGLTSGQILEYNGTHWVNVAKPSGGGSVAWADITGKPTTFAPSAHSHAIGDVTGLQTALNGKQATLVSGTNIKTINGVSVLGSGNITVGGGTTVAWGTETTGQSVQLTVAGTLKTLSLSAHSHSWSQITSKPTTFAPSAHSHAISDVTGLQTALDGMVTIAGAQTITGAKTFSAALVASVSVTTPKVIFAAAGWSVEQSSTELQFKYNGTAKLKMLSDGTFEAVGEITAYA